MSLWLTALLSGAAMAVIGALIERLLLRRLAGQELAQVLLTLGLSFIVADVCLMVWTGDPWQPATPAHLRGAMQVAGLFFPLYRLAIVLIAVILGGTGSLLGALVGSFLIGFLYNFGQAMFPDLAYVILFLPMLLVLVLRPQGLFGRIVS